ncbi:hypothetical protein TWF192_005282 [Orbilia oligospora]|nr:hypothetical protein TWF192_005282 [Orbilia oligospora]
MLGPHGRPATPTPPITVATSNRSRSTLGVPSPPPAYAPVRLEGAHNTRPNPPPQEFQPFEIQDPPYHPLKIKRTYITFTGRDIRILTVLTGVQYIFKSWWIVSILIALFGPSRQSGYSPDASDMQRKKPHSQIVRAVVSPDVATGYRHGRVVWGFGDGDYLNRTGMKIRNIPQGAADTVGDTSSIRYKLAIAAIVVTFVTSLVKLCLLQRMRVKGRYSAGVDIGARRGIPGDGGPGRDDNTSGRRETARKERYVLGAWWEGYVFTGHWVTFIDEVLGLILTVCLMQGEEKSYMVPEVAGANARGGD